MSLTGCEYDLLLKKECNKMSGENKEQHPFIQFVPQSFPESIELTRGQKGGYGWTIKAQTFEKIVEIDDKLREKFGGKENA